MIIYYISPLIQLLAFIFGLAIIASLVTIVVRLTILTWKNIPQAILGSNGRMEPVELAAVITGQLSILMVLSPPLLSFQYDNSTFMTVFTAFMVSTGVYAYKELKKNGTTTKVPEK